MIEKVETFFLLLIIKKIRKEKKIWILACSVTFPFVYNPNNHFYSNNLYKMFPAFILGLICIFSGYPRPAIFEWCEYLTNPY